MPSGLLKYVGRSGERSSLENADEAMKERIKARMEKMGMVEPEGLQSPGTPVRGTLNHVSSNRQIIADQARVTPRSLKLTRSTSHAPQSPDNRWKSYQGQMAPPQRRDSLPEIQFDPHYSGSDGGMFDTDAENLESTIHLSEEGEEPLQRIQGSGGVAAISNDVFQEGSEYEESMPASKQNHVSGRTDSGDNLKIESIDVDGLTSDGSEDSYQGSNDDGPQYGSEATHDTFQGPRDTGGYALVVHTPNSRQKAIETVLESPSIQQSLAYRTAAGPPKQATSTISSKIDTIYPAVNASAFEAEEGGSRYLADTHHSSSIKNVPLQAKGSVHPGDDRIFVRDSSGFAVKQHRQQPEQSLRSEPVHGGQQSIVQDGSLKHALPQIHPKWELNSVHSKSSGQETPQADTQPSMTAGNISQKDQVSLAQTMWQVGSKATKQQPTSSLRDRPDTRAGVPPQSPMPITARDIITKPRAQFNAPQDTDTERSESPLPADVHHMNDAPLTSPKHPGHRKRPLELDYTPTELSGMTYKLLSSESFDHIPKPNTASLPTKFTEATVTDKVQKAYDLKDDDARRSYREAIFSHLTIEQYEEAGDILLERFCEVAGRYKEARRSKRNVAKELEIEVAQREQLVRGKTVAIDGDFIGLRQAGQKVVQGKYAKQTGLKDN